MVRAGLPSGDYSLPGFEDRSRFLPLTFPGREPLVFLQSLDRVELCFLALPVLRFEWAYRRACPWLTPCAI